MSPPYETRRETSAGGYDRATKGEADDPADRVHHATIETAAYEIYGSPDPQVVQMMRAFADRAGVPLTVHPEHVGG
jgi:hypothetical protein